MFEHFQLNNKVKVYLIPLDHTHSVTVLIMYPVGSRYEPEKLSGVSHYIEHLMFKGTKKRPSTLILTREIDRLGAEYNAFTSKEYTGYYIKIDAKFMATALDILSDMLFNSVFDPKEMEKEKTVIVEEIRMYNDNPLINIDNIFEAVMYSACPLGREVAGTEKRVLSYRRREVLGYRDRYYQPGNITVVAAGGLDGNIHHLIEKCFGVKRDLSASRDKFTPFAYGPAEKEKRIVVQRKHTDQAQLMLGWPAFSHEDKRNIVAAVMNMILGGSMSSRLFIQIRERRGLAYMVKSGAENFRDTGYVYVRAGLEGKNINQAVAVMQSEIEKVINQGVTKRELADAKTHIRGALTLSLEDSSTQANWYASQALFHKKIKTPEAKLQEIEAVTNEQIQALAAEVFKMEKMRVAVIGDVEPGGVIF